MRYLSSLPTWILTCLMIPFLRESHPWKHRRFTLEDWSTHQTEACKQFDLMLWITLPGALSVLLLHLA